MTRWSGNRWRERVLEGVLRSGGERRAGKTEKAEGRYDYAGTSFPVTHAHRRAARPFQLHPDSLFSSRRPTPAPSPSGIKGCPLTLPSTRAYIYPTLARCVSRRQRTTHRGLAGASRSTQQRSSFDRGAGGQGSANQLALSLARCVSSRVAGPCASSRVFDRVPLNQDAREGGSGEAHPSFLPCSLGLRCYCSVTLNTLSNPNLKWVAGGGE
ncbi:hypothetical protein C8R44DRAFT_239833 [Mycena epipterygia]|nr:hypothetical protein C8R44DRAFT_239833 [Mycena epipterygia]